MAFISCVFFCVYVCAYAASRLNQSFCLKTHCCVGKKRLMESYQQQQQQGKKSVHKLFDSRMARNLVQNQSNQYATTVVPSETLIYITFIQNSFPKNYPKSRYGEPRQTLSNSQLNQLNYSASVSSYKSSRPLRFGSRPNTFIV